MKQLLITFLLLLLTSPAFAGSLIFTWDAPAADDPVEFYTLYQVDPAGAVIIADDGITGQTTTLYYDTERGVYSYYVTANAWGEESDPSNTVNVRIGKPNQPRNLNAQKKK